MDLRIALAGNPNCGKTTLFNALTGSNQFVGNWPGVTVEKKEGKLKKHSGVVVTDLPGIYSLSPYTLEEVVARNYLIGERPDVILNIIDGTNLERNLYLTTQLTELGIPVVVAINMMDIVRKNGDKIDTAELGRQLGCKVVEISALKGTGIMEAAEAAIDAAKNTKTIPMHTFSGCVEHAIAHIEEAAVHGMPEEQQRWYAVKIFERDDKVLGQLNIDQKTLAHIEADIQAAEKELDDDAESIITNERYVYIASIIKSCYKKKSVGQLSTSDKIDKVVTNRWLGLPIFAVIMFLVYYISMVTVGTAATDWANDGLFGDGYHLLGIGSAEYEDASEAYGEAMNAVDAFIGTGADGADALSEALDTESETFDPAAAASALEAYAAQFADTDTADIDIENEEDLSTETVTYTGADLKAAPATLAEYEYAEPDPAAYGVWVPGIPVLIGSGLEAANTPEWLNGLILDGIVAGVGAVLGFVPQMLVLFLLLAFLEACGYMSRIAFVLDRIFRKFGLSGKSFIPILIGTGCGVPGIMASRTIENERDRRMTIMTTTFIPCGAKMPFISMVAGAIFGGSAWVSTSAYFLGMACIIVSGIMLKKTKMFSGRPGAVRHGAAGLPPADRRQRAPLHVGARLVLHQEGRHDHPALHDPRLVPQLLRLCGRHLPHADRRGNRLFDPRDDRQRDRLDLRAARLGHLAGHRRLRHGPHREGKHRRHHGHPLRRLRLGLCEHRRGVYGPCGLLLPRVQPALRPLLRGDRRDQARDELRKVDLVCDRLPVPVRLRGFADDLPDRLGLHRKHQRDRPHRGPRRRGRHHLHAVQAL
jgi:ferrous iron transport protein B